MSNYVVDNTFGIKTVNFGTGRDTAYSVVELSDGFVLSGPVAGTSTDFGSAKLDKTNGTLVTSFGQNGLIRTGFPGSGTKTDVPVISINSGDNYYVGGSAQFGATGTNNLLFAIAKYDKDGVLSTDYGTDATGQFNGHGLTYVDIEAGGVNDEIFGMKIDSENKLVATGFSNPGVIVGAGPAFNFGTARYEPNGEIDKKFGVNGVVITDFEGNGDDRANDLLIRKNEDIIIGGRTKLITSTNFNFALVSVDKDGDINKKFGKKSTDKYPNLSTQKGKVINNFGNNDLIIKLLADNTDCNESNNFKHFYAAGRSGTTQLAFILVKYDKNGCIDEKFGVDGVLRFNFEETSTDTLNSAFLDKQGRIYLVGNSAITGRNRFAIARVKTDGKLDESFGPNSNGKMVLEFPGITSGFVRDGKMTSCGDIILCGEALVAGTTTADFIAFKLVLESSSMFSYVGKLFGY